MKYITFDRKGYHQVNNTFIYVYTHSRTHCRSLVERGANGGVTGKYVTVLNTYPYRQANILVIDNHDIISVHIYTIVALDKSQAGPVIIIMHQYAYYIKGNTIHSSVQI